MLFPSVQFAADSLWEGTDEGGGNEGGELNDDDRGLLRGGGKRGSG